jgi:hypothetical protein
MITLMSVHTVAPGREEEYVAIQQRLWEHTWKLEPDTIRYEHFRGTKPGQFVSLLTFKDLRHFLDHQVADYHDDVNWEGLFIEHELQWLDPLPGAGDLGQSVIDPLPADLDEARRMYAAMLPAERPAWWGPVVRR